MLKQYTCTRFSYTSPIANLFEKVHFVSISDEVTPVY